MKTRSTSGFSLAELIIVVSILALLAGVVAPVAMRSLVTEARNATDDELEILGDAVGEYFRDVGALPTDLDDLVVDPGATGWSGPYLLSSTPADGGGLSDVAADAWGRAYQLTTTGVSVLTITSSGEDFTFGTDVDLERTVDVTPIRREVTLRELQTINQAITSYNASYIDTSPLPANYTQVLAQLVSTGYLPTTAPYETDGWGDAYDATPSGATPVVRVASPNVSTGLGGS